MKFNRTFYKKVLFTIVAILLFVQLMCFLYLIYLAAKPNILRFFDPALKRQITISPGMQYIKDDFYIKKECSHVDVSLDFDNEVENQAKDKNFFDHFKNKTLPVDVVWDLYKKQDQGYQLIGHFDKGTTNTSSANQKSMFFNLGSLQLSEGDYQIKIHLTNSNPKLEWMNMNIVVATDSSIKCDNQAKQKQGSAL